MVKRIKQGTGRSPNKYQTHLPDPSVASGIKKLAVFAFAKGEARAKIKKLAGVGGRLPVGIEVVQIS